MTCFKKALTLVSVIAVVALSGCGAMHTAMNKQDLEVRTLMSKTIFLEPIAQDKKTIFVEVKNTSGNPNLALEEDLAYELSQRGYSLVQDPEKANLMIQANVLQVDKANVNEMNSAVDSGFGGGLIGASIVGAAGGGGRAMLGAGIAGAALGVALDAMTKDICYIIVTDVQISERAHPNQKLSAKNPWKRQQTRIVSSASKVNLELEEAIPELVQGMTLSIAGLV